MTLDLGAQMGPNQLREHMDVDNDMVSKNENLIVNYKFVWRRLTLCGVERCKIIYMHYTWKQKGEVLNLLLCFGYEA